MTKLKVLTDSTCNLPARYYRDYDIGVIPINIQFGANSFQEGVTIDQRAFYQKVTALNMVPQTSQPSVGQFAEVYRSYARQGYDTVISIHVTGKLSGTLNSATLAAQEVAQEIRVVPYDSLAGTAALGYMCVDIREWHRAGKSVEEITAALDQKRPRAAIFFTLATTRYAQMSGRISYLQGFIASLLNVKPIISLQDGQLLPSGRVRSRHAAMTQLIDLAKQAAGDRPVKFAVIHAEVPAEAEQLLEQAKRVIDCQESFMGDIPISLAVHFGPGALATVVYPA